MAQSVKEKVDGLKTECSAIAKSTSKEGYTYINAKTKRYSLNNDYAIIDVADIAKGSKVNNIVIDASNVKGVILNTEGVTFGNVYTLMVLATLKEKIIFTPVACSVLMA